MMFRAVFFYLILQIFLHDLARSLKAIYSKFVDKNRTHRRRSSPNFSFFILENQIIIYFAFVCFIQKTLYDMHNSWQILTIVFVFLPFAACELSFECTSASINLCAIFMIDLMIRKTALLFINVLLRSLYVQFECNLRVHFCAHNFEHSRARQGNKFSFLSE